MSFNQCEVRTFKTLLLLSESALDWLLEDDSHGLTGETVETIREEIKGYKSKLESLK